MVRCFVFACLALLAACATPASHSARCALPVAPTIIAQSGDPHAAESTLLQSWTFADFPELWRTSAPPAIEAWRAAYIADGEEIRPDVLLTRNGTANSRIVLRNMHWIAPATCVEALLLEQQFARIPLATASTEFAAFILRAPDNETLRIYSYTRNINGIGRLGPISSLVEADVRAGWTLEAGLHNHNFYPSDALINGITAPSGADAHSSLNMRNSMGLRAMWVTNGIDTVRIPADQFDQLSHTD